MSNKEDTKALKTLAVPIIIGTFIVVGVALLGKIMTEKITRGRYEARRI